MFFWFDKKLDVHLLRNTIFVILFYLFFCDLSWIVVCSVAAVTRTSGAGHPLHQAVSCHFLSFHFIFSVFPLPFFDHVFFVFFFFSSFEKFLFCSIFHFLKESFPSVFYV